MKSEWKECMLGDIITFQRGYDLPRSRMTGTGYPVVGSNGVIGYHSEYNVTAPCITIGRSGNVGNPHMIKGAAWAHNTTLFIKEYRNTDPCFVFYFLKTLNLDFFAGGSAVPTLNRNHIHSLNVRVPSLATQRKIAAVLSSLDDKIETNNAICRNLETVGGFMLQHYIEQCSTHVKLSSLMGVENGYAFKSKEYSATGAYKVVTIKNVLDGRVDAMDASGMDEIPADMRHGCRLAVGDVLVSLTGNVGRVGIVTQDKLLLNQRVAKIVPKKKSLLPFLYFYFRNETFKARLEALARGTAQPNLSTTETLALEITTDEKGAEKLSSSLTPLIWQIITRFQENERLSTLRDTLLPRLMRGELDVSAVNLR